MKDEESLVPIQSKGYMIDQEITQEQTQLFEEMESVLYSISFGT
jgi:hypothetical protein